MEHSIYASFEYRPKTFYSVCVDSISERVGYGMVYFNADEVAFILFIENVVPRKLVCHNGVVTLASLFENCKKLFATQLLALIVIISDNRVNLACIAFLYSDYRCF